MFSEVWVVVVVYFVWMWFMVSVVPTAPGGLPGLRVMPRYAQADLLPNFKPPVGLQKQILALIKKKKKYQGTTRKNVVV